MCAAVVLFAAVALCTTVFQDIADDGGFSPVDVVAGILSEIGAVAAVRGFNEGDVRVGDDLGAGFHGKPDEGIVEGKEDERGHGDAVNDAGTGGAVVVVGGVLEVAVAGDDFVVEVAQRANASQAVASEDSREQADFAAITAHEPAKKMPLVETIGRLVERVRAGGEVDGGTHRCDRAKRLAVAPFSSEFEDEIAAHGIADQREPRETKSLRIVIDNGSDVS